MGPSGTRLALHPMGVARGVTQVFNFSARKVGGLTFVKLGRLTFSYSISRAYRAMATKPRAACAPRLASRVVDGRRVLCVA